MDLHRDRSKITGCRLAIASWTGAWMRSTVARSSSPSSVITAARLSVLREVVTFEVIGAFPLLRGKPRRRRPNRLPRQVFGSRLGDYPGAAPENPESGQSPARPRAGPGSWVGEGGSWLRIGWDAQEGSGEHLRVGGAERFDRLATRGEHTDPEVDGGQGQHLSDLRAGHDGHRLTDLCQCVMRLQDRPEPGRVNERATREIEDQSAAGSDCHLDRLAELIGGRDVEVALDRHHQQPGAIHRCGTDLELHAGLLRDSIHPGSPRVGTV